MKDYSRFAEYLNVSFDDHILTVAQNTPPMNCNNDPLHKSLTQIWEDIHDDDDVNVVIFTGEGRAFSAGGDVKLMQYTIDHPHTWWKTVSEAKRIVFRMLECDKPIVARVNGHAVGFGATLALASDIIVAVDTALFGDPHVKAGLVAGDGGARAPFWARRSFAFAARSHAASTAPSVRGRRCEPRRGGSSSGRPQKSIASLI